MTVNGAAQTITLTLAAADLYGTAVDHLGQQVLDATVYATRLVGHHQQRDRTSRSGYYAIGGLITGTYLLTATPPWYEGALLPPGPITVALPGATPPYTLTFRAPPKVATGTVTDEHGTGIAGGPARLAEPAPSPAPTASTRSPSSPARGTCSPRPAPISLTSTPAPAPG